MCFINALEWYGGHCASGFHMKVCICGHVYVGHTRRLSKSIFSFDMFFLELTEIVCAWHNVSVYVV